MPPQPRRNAAQLLASQGTQQINPWNPETGQLDMGMYEFALRHPGIKNLGVLKDQWIGSKRPENAAQYTPPVGGPQALNMTPGKAVTLGPKPTAPAAGTPPVQDMGTIDLGDVTPDKPFAKGMDYKGFVKAHGGKSTANLAGLFRQGTGGEVTDKMKQGMKQAAARRGK